ncbi:hypothetical protein JR316_0008270 [Psilocybe cubensis]|uniref:Uncharacterized protein n=2 Tax=Psilocybe cubensis TaxID=181762 RepID=A0A8H7XRV5_PSICU|nr:hypothetical protein JR316_0008270 [Psilocybe cubensis]KAH9479675.1 hypothetical protein JR316_0008270 [Psilocybe cubensis]
MPDLYIPPEKFYFRLLGYSSNLVLFSRDTFEPYVWHYHMGPEYDDQLFQLIHGTGEYAGQYAIKSKKTGKVLFSRPSPNPTIGHIEGDGKYRDNWFKFEVGSGTFSTFFRIVCPSNSLAWVSRTTRDPQVANYNSTGEKYADQYFSFIFEDTIIDHVEYHVDQGKILSSTPIVIATQSLKNDTDTSQTSEASINVSTQETSTFQFAQGFSIKVGATFTTGVPFIAEGKISTEITSTSTFTWGSSTTTSKAYTARFPVTAPAHTVVRAISSVTRSDLDIPITVYSKSKETGVEVKTEGRYYGVTTWDLRHTVSQD